ncbi:MAG: tetratricopeptide repeat protein, partial [Desulfobacterales bacterium]|nr:tetratricopeptide repeat protein [Desulfobacterales bacterium]
MNKRLIRILSTLTAAAALTALVSCGSAVYAREALPLAAGICIDRARIAFHNGNVSEAVDILAEFRDRGNGKTAETIRRKGYDHSYVHFLFGSYSLTLSQDSEGLEARRRLKRAMEGFERAVQAEPGFSEAWLNLAKCRYESGDHSRAADAFRRGYETSETPKPNLLYYAAVCRFRSDDPQGAL